MGDVISILHALQLLRTAMPHAFLQVVVEKQYKPLFRFVPSVDTVFGYDRTTSPLGLLAALSELRRERFDLICSMSPSYRNAFLASFIQAKARVGYFEVQDSLTPFLHPTSVEGHGINSFNGVRYDHENIYKRSLKICQALGISLDQGETPLHISSDDMLSLERRLARKGFDVTTNYVVIHPFAGWKFRYWSFKETASLANMIVAAGTTVVLIGDEKERRLGDKISSMVKNQERVLKAFGLPLDELVMVLKNAKAFVGTDSGPLHLAVMLSTPSVGLYGPAHPRFTAPVRLSDSYLFEQVDCSPCNQRICVRPQNPCMNLLSAEKIYPMLDRYLGSPS